MAKIPTLIAIHHQIIKVLKANPDGLDIYEIRSQLPKEVGVQQHLDKRVRDLRYFYDVPLESRNKRSVYVFKGPLAIPAVDGGRIDKKLRAQVLHRAHGRCQMCGKTVAEDKIKLEADHKIPRTWGGATTDENLWALCQLCNGGKRDFFATIDDAEMRIILAKESVYERLAETLRLHLGKPTPSWLLEFVANAEDWQEDWHKRLRELRYPGIDLKIKATRSKAPSGRHISAYQLDKWIPIPSDHKKIIKDHEKRTRAARKAAKLAY